MSDHAVSLDDVQAGLNQVREEVSKRIVGQEAVLNQLLACLLADGNALLESNPGLAKTLTVRTVAEVTDLGFSRIQNTPDLMPSDITGTEIIRESDAGRDFVFQRGPVFSNIVLADEINRATPKTQAALLEAMEEKQVTAAGETHALPDPFFLLATQNPIDLEGSLHPDETLYVNGRLRRAGDVAAEARSDGELVHDTGDTRLYDADATTQTLTPDGRLRETDCLVYEIDYDGLLYTVETKTGRTIQVTGNHPFLVNRDGVVQWVEARDLGPADFLVSPRRLDLPEAPFPSHREALNRLEQGREFRVVRRERVESLLPMLAAGEPLDHDEVDDLRIAAGLTKKALSGRVEATYDRVLNNLAGAENGLGDALATALSDAEIEPGDSVESARVHRIDDVLSPADAGFFVGFILAEGHVSETAISVSQKNLLDDLDRWIDLAERIGLDAAVREDETDREACISSKAFVGYLEERFHLDDPGRLLSAPESFKRSFLEIFVLTKSHFDAERRRITLVQTDRTLVNVLAHLFLEFGILPWLYDREDHFEIRIQGEDIDRYVEQFEWRGAPPDAELMTSVHRSTPVPREEATRVVDLLGMKYDRPWYTSHRWMRTRHGRMATPYFEPDFLDDVEDTLARRRAVSIEAAAADDLGAAAKLCGRSMTDVAAESGVDKNAIWAAYQTDRCPEAAVDYVVREFDGRMAEAEEIVADLHGLVDGDVFYDRVKSVESRRYVGPVVGLSVPSHHNYLAGLGACGINHNTYPLPEAQADRFLMKVLLDYPSFEEEREIVDRYTRRLERFIPVERVLSREELVEYQELTREVPIADDIRDHAIQLVQATREAETVEFGASPRASMGLVVAAKARALLQGRAHVSEADVEAMAPPVLRHRLVVDFRAEREGMTPDDVIHDLR